MVDYLALLRQSFRSEGNTEPDFVVRGDLSALRGDLHAHRFLMHGMLAHFVQPSSIPAMSPMPATPVALVSALAQVAPVVHELDTSPRP